MRAHKNHKTTTKQEKFLILCKNFLSSRLGEFLLFSIQTIKMTQNFVHRLMKIILLLLCEVNWLSCPVKLKSDSWIEREWKSFLICFLVPSRSRVKNKHIIFFVIVQHISQTHMELVAPGDLNDKDYKKKNVTGKGNVKFPNIPATFISPLSLLKSFYTTPKEKNKINISRFFFFFFNSSRNCL